MWDRGEVQPGNMREFRSDTKDKAGDESDEGEMTVSLQQMSISIVANHSISLMSLQSLTA